MVLTPVSKPTATDKLDFNKIRNMKSVIDESTSVVDLRSIVA
jgi:hypothetical protein